MKYYEKQLDPWKHHCYLKVEKYNKTVWKVGILQIYPLHVVSTVKVENWMRGSKYTLILDNVFLVMPLIKNIVMYKTSIVRFWK